MGRWERGGTWLQRCWRGPSTSPGTHSSGSTCTPVVLFCGRWPAVATWLKLLRLSHTGFPLRLRPLPIPALRRSVSWSSPRRCGQPCHRGGETTQGSLFSARPSRNAGIMMLRLVSPPLVLSNDFNRCDSFQQAPAHQRRSPCQLSHHARLHPGLFIRSRCACCRSTQPTATRSPSQPKIVSAKKL